MKNLLNAVKRCGGAAVAAGKDVAVEAAGLLGRPSVIALAGLAAGGITHANAAAATVDVTDVVATITAGVVVISSIGTAVLSLVVVIKLFKWVQRAL